jgi:hypothetical protein
MFCLFGKGFIPFCFCFFSDMNLFCFVQVLRGNNRSPEGFAFHFDQRTTEGLHARDIALIDGNDMTFPSISPFSEVNRHFQSQGDCYVGDTNASSSYSDPTVRPVCWWQHW